MNTRANLKAVQVLEPTAGKLTLAHMNALSLVDHVYRASVQTEGSDARRSNVRAAILDLDEVAKRLGYELVPARGGNHG
jgi:hypothetical protein